MTGKLPRGHLNHDPDTDGFPVDPLPDKAVLPPQVNWPEPRLGVSTARLREKLPRTYDFTSEFGPEDKVHIDGDKSITATVTGHLFRGTFKQLECSWFGNGAHQQAWIEEWRLRHAPRD